MEERTSQELLGIVKRCMTDEMLQLLDVIDAEFGLNRNVFTVLSNGGNNASDAVLAKEGARAYSDLLRNVQKNLEEKIRMETMESTHE